MAQPLRDVGPACLRGRVHGAKGMGRIRWGLQPRSADATPLADPCLNRKSERTGYRNGANDAVDRRPQGDLVPLPV